jgi:hypothetical protein
MDDRDFMKTNRYDQSNPNRWLFDKRLRVPCQTRVAVQRSADDAMGKACRRGADLSYRAHIATVLGLK